MLVQQHSEKIYHHYNSSAVAAGYGQHEYLTPCEHLLFDTYIKPGMAVLDIGGGRTSRTPKNRQSNYIFTLFRKVLDLSARFLMAVRGSARLALGHGSKPPFWQGKGYLLDEKLIIHFWTVAGLAACVDKCK